VLRARIFARRASGGRIELLLVEPTGEGGGGRGGPGAAPGPPPRRRPAGGGPGPGGFAGSLVLPARPEKAGGSAGMEWNVRFEDPRGERIDPARVMEGAGHVPLPPYVERADDERDAARYQTVYARAPGAVAAPTAGLHFTPELLAELERRGIA